MDTDSAYITISRESVVFSQTRTELNSTKINVTGFQEPIRLNIKPMIRESQGYLKSSGKGKESWGCVQKPTTVLGRKISYLAKELTRKCYSDKLYFSTMSVITQQLGRWFVLMLNSRINLIQCEVIRDII